MTTAPQSDPSQPTIYEMLRMQSVSIQHQGETLARMEGAMNTLVTQEQRSHDLTLLDERHRQVTKRLDDDEQRSTWAKRAAVTAFGAPLIVGVMLFVTGATLQLPA